MEPVDSNLVEAAGVEPDRRIENKQVIDSKNGQKGQNRVKGVGMRLYIDVADKIDEVAARAKANGVTLAREPHDTDWGARAFEVKEPSGFLITFVSMPAT